MFWFCAHGRWAQCFSSVCCCNVAKEQEHPHHCCLFTINGFQVKHLILQQLVSFLFLSHCVTERICELIWPKANTVTILSQTKLPLRSTVTFTQENFYLWNNSKNWHPQCILQFWLPLKLLQFYTLANHNILFLTLLIKRQKTPHSFRKSLY